MPPLFRNSGAVPDVGDVVGAEETGPEQLVDPSLLALGLPRRPGLPGLQRGRSGDRGQHVGPEDVVVVGVDGRDHLLGLGHVGADEGGVDVGRVVPLTDRVDGELPVAVDQGREPVALGHLSERVGLELEDAVAEEGAQRHGVLGQVDEDEPREHLAGDLGHAQRALVEVEELLLVGDMGDAAVEPVAPPVVLAGELAARAAGLLAAGAPATRPCCPGGRTRCGTRRPSRRGLARARWRPGRGAPG